MKKTKLNMLVKASVKSEKLPLSLFSLFLLLSSLFVLLAGSIIFPFADNINNNICNHIYNRELTITYSDSTAQSEINSDIAKIKELDYVKQVYECPDSVTAYETTDTLGDEYTLDFLHGDYSPVMTCGEVFDETESNVAIVPELIKDYNADAGKIVRINGADLLEKTLCFDCGSGAAIKLKVVGVYNTADSVFSGKEIIIPRRDLLKINESESSELISENVIKYQIVIDSYKNADKAKEEISAIHSASFEYFTGIDTGTYQTATILILASFAVLLLMIVAAMYILLNSQIKNRTGELALYRSIGYKSGHIFYIIFSEYLIVGVASLALGFLSAAVLNEFVVNRCLDELVGGTLFQISAEITPLYLICILAIFAAVLIIVCKLVVRKSEKTDLTVLLREH